jgi:arylsulfatase
VLIVADDLGWGELGCYGQEKIRTPNLDALAAAGMRFTRAYAGAPVCAPSRCVLLTGMNLARAPIRGNKETGEEGQTPLPTSVRTWASVLQEAGYVTGAMGKWGLGMPGTEGSPSRHGFTHFLGYYCQRKAHSYYPAYLWNDERKVSLNNGPAGVPAYGKGTNYTLFQGQDYASDRLVAEATAWLAQRAADPRPFMLYLPFIEPHVALQAPRRIVDSYPREWDPAPYLGDKGYCPVERPRAAYAALVTSLDEHVGEIMLALKRLHLETNTVVIFTSDNGATHDVGGVDTGFFNSVGGLRGRKGSLHEGGIRVPFIARWPGRTPAGRTSEEVVAFADLFPTFCELAGLPVPKGDGLSLLPLLQGRPLRSPRPPIVSDFPEYGGQQSVLDGKWKLIRKELAKAKPHQPPAWELYDLSSDPNETTDLAASHRGEVSRLEAIFEARRTANPLFPTFPSSAN